MATQIAITDDLNASAVPAITPEGERFALRQRQARMFAMSPLVPDHLRKGPIEQAIANCWIALTLAEAMGEVPLIVMQNIHVVNGKAGFASQYMIARANSAGIFIGRIDWRIDRSDPTNLSVTAYAVLKDTGQEVSVTCDMAMAQAEGWTKNPKYKTMPEVMLRYRSAAFLVRFYAPDVMLGYQTAEEVEDVVAADAPSAPRLTGDMLLKQANPDLAATPANPEPSERRAEPLQSDEAAATPASEHGPAPTNPREQAQPEEPSLMERMKAKSGLDKTPADDPTRIAGDDWIARFNGCETIAALDEAYRESATDRGLFPADVKRDVEAAHEATETRLKAGK